MKKLKPAPTENDLRPEDQGKTWMYDHDGTIMLIPPKPQKKGSFDSDACPASFMLPIPFNELPEVLTASQARDFLRISRNTMYEQLEKGRIASVRLGQQYRISKAEIADVLRGNVEAKERRDPKGSHGQH